MSFGSILKSVGKGALSVGKSALPILGGPVGGALASLIPSAFGALEGAGQRRQAKNIRANAKNPGFQTNDAVIQNAELLKNRYSNYQMPGYNQQLDRIGTNSASAFNNGVQGASSGGDVLDLATKIAYGQGQQQNQLAVQNAQGKDAAFGNYLQGNAAAGNEAVKKNQYDRDQYNGQLAEAAGLYEAGGQNINSALTGAASTLTSALMNPSRVPKARKQLNIPGQPIPTAGVTPSAGLGQLTTKTPTLPGWQPEGTFWSPNSQNYGSKTSWPVNTPYK